MEGMLERAHQTEKSAGTVSTGLRLGRAVGGVRGLDEAAISEAGTEKAAGDEHGIDLIAAAGDKLKSVASGLVDHAAPSTTELATALSVQAGAPLSVDLEQIAGSSLTTPGTTSGGGLPVSSAAPPSAEATPAPAVPIPAVPEPLATGSIAPDLSTLGTIFEANTTSLTTEGAALNSLTQAITTHQASIQADASNTASNTSSVQGQTSAAAGDAEATKTSTTAVTDNRFARPEVRNAGEAECRR